MNTFAGGLRSRHTSHWLLGLSAVLLAAGVAAVLVVVFSRSGSAGLSTAPVTVKVPVKEKSVPVSPEARKVVSAFILTAVARKHLAQAWPISGPGIREGMSRKEFLTGNIAVVPVFESIVKATITPSYSHPRDALLQVAMVVKGPGTAGKLQVKLFSAGIKLLGNGTAARWVVDSWVPKESTPVQARPT